jgi:MFS family permease
MDNSGIAMFISAVIFGGILLQFPIGHQSDLYDRRKVLTVVAYAGAGSALATYFIGGHAPVLFFILAILYGGFSFTIYALCVSHTHDQIHSSEVMEATRTLLLLNGIGAATGPIVAGLLMQLTGTDALMIYFALVLGILALFASYRLKVGTPIPLQEQEHFVPMTRTGTEVVELDPRSEGAQQKGAQQDDA